MIKGTDRRVVVLRDTASESFDEAYFILKRGVGKGKSATDEAKRILREMDTGSKGHRRRTAIFLGFMLFVSGVLLGMALGIYY